jgi:hypothetical protein
MLMALRDVIPVMESLAEWGNASTKLYATNLLFTAKFLRTTLELWNWLACRNFNQEPSILMCATITSVSTCVLGSLGFIRWVPKTKLQIFWQSLLLRILSASTVSICAVGNHTDTHQPFAKPLWGSVGIWVQWHANSSDFLCFLFESCSWCFSILHLEFYSINATSGIETIRHCLHC